MGLIPDEGNDHAVEVEEEHDQMKTELDEGFLRMSSDTQPQAIQNCGRTFLWTFSFLKISVASRRCWFSKILFVLAMHSYNA